MPKLQQNAIFFVLSVMFGWNFYIINKKGVVSVVVVVCDSRKWVKRLIFAGQH